MNGGEYRLKDDAIEIGLVLKAIIIS